ncbi:MAG TPA: hypothetical protein GX523_13285 [Desulfitobacterium dehalogenans]|uniref:Uncharacterized protein n=1 Tax=Desulfitobacterium dehalogenans TaxID=36854 RepID=A0A7C6Z5M8_9FIRM|nr:hypothetical protein [Desulfitobacterium dehalogenans]
MKKNKYPLISLIVLSITILIVTALTPPSEVYKIELKQYQNIINKLNLEYGLEGDSRIRILKGEEQVVYNNIRNMSLEEFERHIREGYEKTLQIPDIIERGSTADSYVDRNENNEAGIVTSTEKRWTNLPYLPTGERKVIPLPKLP